MDDLTTLSIEDLRTLLEEKIAARAALVEIDTPTDEELEQALALDSDVDAIEARIGEVETAAAEKADKWSALKDKVATASDETDEDETDEADEADEDESEDEDEEDEVDEEPVAKKAAAKGTVQTLAKKTPRPKAPAAAARKPITITAAANVPDFNVGQNINMEEVGEALVSRMRNFSAPSGDSQSENLQHYGVAKFAMDFPEDLTLKQHEDDLAVLSHAAREARLEGGSLVAAGGWCAPSETLYDLCTTETVEGILSIPEVNAQRGGIKFTKGPDFSTIYSNVGFLQTEAQAISGTTKTCYEVPCPSFTDVRLDAIGLCIKAPILTNAAYPELVRRWLDGSMVAHAHKVNASVIGRIATAAGTANVVKDFGGTTQSTLAALELLADRLRQKYKLGLNESLEVILPFWVKGAIRSDLSLRTGIPLDAVTDQLIGSHFAARKLNVQFVYDWQEMTVNAVAQGYPATYQALIYPAGAFVKATSNVITLNAVYDAASLATNIYTALFFEQGLAVANMCAEAMKVTLPVCGAGRTGIANVAECGIGTES